MGNTAVELGSLERRGRSVERREEKEARIKKEWASRCSVERDCFLSLVLRCFRP